MSRPEKAGAEGTRKVRKLRVSKETIKDLTTKDSKAEQVKGGRTGGSCCDMGTCGAA